MCIEAYLNGILHQSKTLCNTSVSTNITPMAYETQLLTPQILDVLYFNARKSRRQTKHFVYRAQKTFFGSASTRVYLSSYQRK